MPPSDPIRVIVVDDEALVCTGFAMILGVSDDIEVIATCTGTEAVATIERELPDVVLLDIRMPGVDGLTVLRRVRSLAAPPVVAMLTTFAGDDDVLTALEEGAAGFLLKDTDPEQLPSLVRSLAVGGVVLSPGAARSLASRTPARPAIADATAKRIESLSARELEVLRLVAAGLSSAAIGARTFLSPATVKDHVSSILAKLGVATRVEAALAAQRADVLDGTSGARE